MWILFSVNHPQNLKYKIFKFSCLTYKVPVCVPGWRYFTQVALTCIFRLLAVSYPEYPKYQCYSVKVWINWWLWTKTYQWSLGTKPTITWLDSETDGLVSPISLQSLNSFHQCFQTILCVSSLSLNSPDMTKVHPLLKKRVLKFWKSALCSPTRIYIWQSWHEN